MDAETTSYDEDPFVPVEQLQEYFDELKQKLQRINSTCNNTATTVTGQKQKEVLRLHDEEKKVLNTITSDASNDNGTSKSPECNKDMSILFQGQRSLPHIYSLLNNPSIDDLDGDVWRYVHIGMHISSLVRTCTYVHKHKPAM